MLMGKLKRQGKPVGTTLREAMAHVESHALPPR
jgi:hypothetical protein